MMAAAYQPSEVMVSADQLDPSLLNLEHAQASLAGPDSIYVTSIMYDGQRYSALLKYAGGTTATVEAVFGPMGKLIPDSVGLSQTGFAFMAPATLAVSNVEVGGVGLLRRAAVYGRKPVAGYRDSPGNPAAGGSRTGVSGRGNRTGRGRCSRGGERGTGCCRRSDGR